MDVYLRTFSAFRYAGANLKDAIKVGPLLGRLRSSMLFIAYFKLLEDINSSSTILEEFKRQMWKVSELGKNLVYRRMGLIRRALDAWGLQPAPDLISALKQNALVTIMAMHKLTQADRAMKRTAGQSEFNDQQNGQKRRRDDPVTG